MVAILCFINTLNAKKSPLKRSDLLFSVFRLEGDKKENIGLKQMKG